MASRSNDIGLDSLVSVDIRSWFLKTLQVNTPILKIMSNETMANLVEYVIQEMPVELTPHMDRSTEGPAREDTDASSGVEAPAYTIANHNDTASGKLRKSNGVEPIDWESESSPPKIWASIPFVVGQPPSTPPTVIVLTGVTGLLGHHLLEHLLKYVSAKTIHCPAIRKLTDRLHNNELSTNPRVRYYPGDLSDPRLGLSDEEASSIFASADVVIHNGADTSHMKFYSDIQASNVGSTKNLARLCLPRRVPFHYISSAGVAIYSNQTTFPEVSVMGPGSLYPAADGAFGYGCSKWVNERLLERSCAEFGLPVYIYRPSTIIREAADAITANAQFDWVNALLHYVRKLRAAPKTEHNLGALDLVRVESCCADVLKNINGKSDSGKSTVTYVNQVGDIIIPIDRMRDMDANLGKRYDLLPLSEWTSRAIAAGLHPSVAALIEEMDAQGKPGYPRLLRR